MKVSAKASIVTTLLMLAFMLLLRGNLLLGRLVANTRTIAFAQRMVHSQQDPVGVWLQCSPKNSGRAEILDSPLQRSSADPAMLAAQGMAYWLAGYCTEAAESYAAAASRAPWNDTYWTRLGLIYFAVGDPDASANALRHLPSWKSLYSLGKAAKGLDAAGLVELCYQLSVEKTPSPWMAEYLSDIYLSQGEREKAIALWEDRVNSTTLADPNHWWAMGQLHMVQGNYESAAAAFHQGAVLSPSYELTYREGDAWAKAGEPAKALRVYESAIELAPNDFWAYWQAGNMALRLRDQERACRLFRKADQISPNHRVNQEYRTICSP